MKIKLVVVGGKKDGMEIPVATPEFRIGRGERCHIRPQSDLIGELHCSISVDGNAVVLEDRGGAVGTFVNGIKVQQRCGLQNNDRIKIGALELEVRLAADVADDKKQPIDEMRNTAAGTVAGGGETDILQWVKQAEKVRSSPPEIVTLQQAKPEKSPRTGQVAAARTPRKKDAFDLEPTELLLLLTIAPLAVVLLSFLPPFWTWRGAGAILLAALACMFGIRAKRAGNVKPDELNAAIGLLAFLVASLMWPTYWGGGVFLLFAFLLILALRMRRPNQIKLDEINVGLLAGVGILAFLLVNLPPSAWLQLSGGAMFLTALAALLGFHMKRSMPIERLPAGGVKTSPEPGIIPRSASKKGAVNRSAVAAGFQVLDLLFLVQIVFIAYMVAYIATSSPVVWQGGGLLLLTALSLMLGVRLGIMEGRRLDEVNLVLVIQISFLTFLVAGESLSYRWTQLGKLAIPALALALYFASHLKSAIGNHRHRILLSLAAIGILAILGLLLPAYWGGSVFLLIALALILLFRMLRSGKIKLDETNIALLAACGVLVFFMLNLSKPTTLSTRITGGAGLMAAFALLLGYHRQQAKETEQLPETDLADSRQPVLTLSPAHATGESRRLWKAIRFDELNLLLLILIVAGVFFVLAGMAPKWYAWLGGNVFLWAALALLLGVRVIFLRARKWDGVNVMLLAQVVFLTPDVAYWMAPYAWVWWGEVVILLAATAAYLWYRRKRVVENRSDLIMLRSVAVGIMLVVVLGFLFPITTWWPA